MSDWFGAPGCIKSGFMGTFIAECVTHAAMAAESNWVGKVRISMRGTARQNCCTILHILIGAAPLD